MRTTSKYTFGQRWLLMANVPKEKIREISEDAQNRAKRYPGPLNRLYPIAVWFLNWFGPLITMFSLQRAHNLSDEKFELFISSLKKHPNRQIRALEVFTFLPLMDAMSEDKTPDRSYAHPLDNQQFQYADSELNNIDVIIIGSGAGGAPVAMELSRQGLKVVIIEKGELVKPELPARILEKHYVGQGFTFSLSGGNTVVLAAATVGGTTSVNSGTCLRPLDEQLRKWDDALGTDFTSGILNPYFDKVENQIGVCVPDRSLLSKSAFTLEKGLKSLGRNGAFVLPRNAPACSASGRCCFGCPSGAKLSTDLAYLPDALEFGAKLLIKSEATKIIEENEGVKVQIQTPEGSKTLTSRNLIISAGALYTPGLLKRNRLGSNWREAGKHLKIHPATKVVAWFPGLDHGEGGIPQCMGYRPPDIPGLTFEGVHTPKSITRPMLPVGGKKFNWWMDHYNDLASFGMMVCDKAAGSVVEGPSFPLVKYKLHPENMEDIRRGIMLMSKAFFAAGAKKILTPSLGRNKNEYESADELKENEFANLSPNDLILSGFHPQGTAGMGRVIDNNLKLIGSKRIYICDGSVLPDSPGVNPMVSIMALSLRLADQLVLERD